MRIGWSLGMLPLAWSLSATLAVADPEFALESDEAPASASVREATATVIPVAGEAEDGPQVNRTDLFIQRFIKRRQQLVAPGENEGWGGMYEQAVEEPEPKPTAPSIAPAERVRRAPQVVTEETTRDWVPTPAEPRTAQAAPVRRPMEEPRVEPAPERQPEPEVPAAIAEADIEEPAAPSELVEAEAPVQVMPLRDPTTPARSTPPMVTAPLNRSVSSAESTTSGLVLEVVGPETVALGDPAEYRIVVRNTNNLRAPASQLNLQLPAGAQLGRVLPTFESGTTRWNLDSIAPGDRREMSIRFTPTTAGPSQVVAQLAVPQSVTRRFEVLAPRLEIQPLASDVLPLGQDTPITITVANTGPVAARDVELLLRVGGNLRSPLGSSPRVRIGQIGPGSEYVAQFTLQGVTSGTAPLQMTLRAAGGIENQTEARLRVVAPDVAIKTQGPEMLAIGRIQEFGVDVTNTGAMDLESVAVIVALSEGLQLVDAETGGHLDESKRLVGWELQRLAIGETRTLRWWIVGHREGLGDQRIFVEAEGGVRKNVRLTQKLTAAPDIHLQMISDGSQVRVGEETIYRFRLVNHGRTSATGLAISGTLSDGLEPIHISGSTDQTWNGNNVQFATIDRLSPGQSRVFQIRARALQSGQTTFDLSVTSRTSGEELDTIEERRTVE